MNLIGPSWQKIHAPKEDDWGSDAGDAMHCRQLADADPITLPLNP